MYDASKPFDMRHVMETPASELLPEMRERFTPIALEKIETAQELEDAQRLMGWCNANYSYLSSVAQELKITKRAMKRDGADKKSFDEILSKEETFVMFAEICKKTYDVTSRMVTVRQLILDELRMNGDIMY